MGRKKIAISKEVLNNLYWDKNLSTYETAKVLGCTFGTITNRLREYQIPRKSSSFARERYQRSDFDGSALTKAYMIGFRLGDLNVYKPTRNSETVVVRCHTTQMSQVNVMTSLFEKFGHVSISNKNGHFQINCFMNKTFEFLLPKTEEVWRWIASDQKCCWAFIAGYTDAEGSFGLNQEKARFKIDSYDITILRWISMWLQRKNISNKLRKIGLQGSIQPGQKSLTWNHDLWRLDINEAKAIRTFIEAIIPFLKHSKRIRDAKTCLENIFQRQKNGTVR